MPIGGQTPPFHVRTRFSGWVRAYVDREAKAQNILSESWVFVVTYLSLVVATMPDSCKDAMSNAEVDGDISTDAAVAADDVLSATNDRKHTDEQAHADDAHVVGADAADKNHDADDATDNDGDAHGTARTLPSKEGSSEIKRISKMTDKDKHFS